MNIDAPSGCTTLSSSSIGSVDSCCIRSSHCISRRNSALAWPRDRNTWSIFAILGPTSLAIPIFLISWGERTIDSAVASILDATVPLFTIVIAHFWLDDDKMTLQKMLGLLVGFAGVIVLLSRD